MLLWDIIRDWFVMNIWGGTTSTGTGASGYLGYFYDTAENLSNDGGFTDGFYVPIGSGLLDGDTGSINGVVNYLALGDWLSTTSTIIVLIAICVGFYFLVRWLFRLTAGLIAGRG